MAFILGMEMPKLPTGTPTSHVDESMTIYMSCNLLHLYHWTAFGYLLSYYIITTCWIALFIHCDLFRLDLYGDAGIGPLPRISNMPGEITQQQCLALLLYDRPGFVQPEPNKMASTHTSCSLISSS